MSPFSSAETLQHAALFERIANSADDLVVKLTTSLNPSLSFETSERMKTELLMEYQNLYFYLCGCNDTFIILPLAERLEHPVVTRLYALGLLVVQDNQTQRAAKEAGEPEPWEESLKALTAVARIAREAQKEQEALSYARLEGTLDEPLPERTPNRVGIHSRSKGKVMPFRKISEH